MEDVLFMEGGEAIDLSERWSSDETRLAAERVLLARKEEAEARGDMRAHAIICAKLRALHKGERYTGPNE